MIRSTSHSLKFINSKKLEEYSKFIKEYRRIFEIIGNSIWNEGYGDFSISKDKLELPLYLHYKKFDLDTWLSARVLSTIVTQLSGLIRGAVETRRKLVYVFNKLTSENRSTQHLIKFLEPITKPEFSKINPEINSLNSNIITGKHFDWFLSLRCIGIKRINIPLKKTKLDLKWEKRGRLMNGISLSDDKITLRYDVCSIESNGTGSIGIDQGILDLLTLSNGETSPKNDIHGHSMSSILDTLSKRKKGSKGFKRAQTHRKNFINWSINKINLSRFEIINFEKIVDLGRKFQTRKLSHFTNTLIRDKVKRSCEETKVLFIEQSCAYRSQRCNECGLVRKSNRKGKIFKCKGCGLVLDSDLNGAININTELPEISTAFRLQGHNRKGFYWNPSGIDMRYEKPIVSRVKKEKI